MMFVTLGAVELKVNKMLLFLAEGGCCCSSPQPALWPQGTVREQEGLGREGEVVEQLVEVPDQRVGEVGDKRAAEVEEKIQCDKWPQCLSRASCLHLQAATLELHRLSRAIPLGY